MVYKVISTELLPLRERALNDLDENRYRSIIQDLLKTSPLYFSYTFDITNSLQRQSEADLTLPLWQRADNRFFWNRFVQSDLIDFSVGKNSRFGHGRKNPGVDPYILPVMFGMLEVRNTSIKGTPLTFILTSRRSRFRAGTRYNSRGIDENGQVSNFNETEQIIILNDEASKGPVSYAGDAGMQYDKLRAAVGKEAQVLSYVQTRGSMPFYWAEVNNLHYTPNLHIRGVDSAMPAVKNHFDEQLAIYGDQYLVNLVKHTGREKRAKEAYEQVVRNLVTGPTSYKEGDQFTSEKIKLIDPSQSNNKYDNIHYIYFDFHNETKGLQFHRTKHLLQQLDQSIRDNAYFRAVDMPGDSQGKVETRSRQTAAVRTNCMDCLDRTNVVQSMVGKHVLTRQLIDLGLLREGETVDSDQAFNHLFRNVWADNADVVSKAYSGTGALKTDFTRTGDRTHKGKFNDLTNSITRYIKNNFLDGPRQDAFDVFLGTYKPNTSQLGKGSIFSDKRPLVVQSIPYILMASLILLFVGFVTRQEETAAVWPLRLAMIVSFIVAVVSFTFMWQYGMLYVGRTLLYSYAY